MRTRPPTRTIAWPGGSSDSEALLVWDSHG